MKPKFYFLLFLFSQVVSAHSVFNCAELVLKRDGHLTESAGKDSILFNYSGHGYELNVVSIDNFGVQAELMCYVYRSSRDLSDFKRVRYERKQILPGKIAIQVFKHLKNIETLCLPLKGIEVGMWRDGESFAFNWHYGQTSNQFSFQTAAHSANEGYDLSRIIKQKDSIDEIINLKGYRNLLFASLKQGIYTNGFASVIEVKKSDPMFKKWDKVQANIEVNDSTFFETKMVLKDSLQMVLNKHRYIGDSGICRVMVLLDKFGSIEKLDIKKEVYQMKNAAFDVEKVKRDLMLQLQGYNCFFKKEGWPIAFNMRVCFLIEFKQQVRVVGFW